VNRLLFASAKDVMKMSREKNVGDIANRHEMRKYVVRLEKFL
jgi:hypothetical protein